MVAFNQHGERENRLDLEILRDGSVALYWRREYLSEDIEWLRQQNYQVFSFNCSEWSSDDAMHNDLQRVLPLPAYYGRNFDALYDSVEELAVPDVGGFALVLNRYDAYSKSLGATVMRSGQPRAQVILDIFARGSRYFLLTGRRFLTLLQSDDPQLRFERLACVHADWNRREHLYEDRGLDSAGRLKV